jgi:hypothetical protein
MRAAWNRRSPPEISRRVANCPRKITGVYVYSICWVADAGIGVLSRACPDNTRSDSPPRTQDIAPRILRNRRHFSQCQSKSHPSNRDAPRAPFSQLILLRRARARAHARVRLTARLAE